MSTQAHRELLRLAGTMDTPLITSEIHPQNDYYGHAAVIKEYVGFPKDYQIKAAIEHGIFLGNFVWDVDINAPLPGMLFPSAVRYEVIRCNSIDKLLFAVGPIILYAKGFMDDKAMAAERARLGRTLLVFPAHSTHWTDARYDIDNFCKTIYSIAKDFDSVRICLYWKDVLLGAADIFSANGFECVTAGHIYSPDFLKRLRDIIELSDLVITNDFGTHVGYSVLFNKPTCLLKTELSHYTSDLRMRLLEEDNQRKILKKEDKQILCKAFSELRTDISSKQFDIVNRFWGTFDIKNECEMRNILLLLEEIYLHQCKTNRQSILQAALDKLSRCLKIEDVDQAAWLATRIELSFPKFRDLPLLKSYIAIKKNNKLEAIRLLKNFIRTNPARQDALHLLQSIT